LHLFYVNSLKNHSKQHLFRMSSKSTLIHLIVITLCVNATNLQNPKEVTQSNISNFIPSGYHLIDSLRGDLNRDSVFDVLLIVDKNKTDNLNPYEVFKSRSLLILLGTSTGYQLAAQNQNAVLCKTCGDNMTDPFSGFVIDDGYFSINYSGKQRYSWKKKFSFKYLDSAQTWILERIRTEVLSERGSEKVQSIHSLRKNDFGNISFNDFNVYEIDNNNTAMSSGNIFGNIYSDGGLNNIAKGGIWHALDDFSDSIIPCYLSFMKIFPEEDNWPYCRYTNLIPKKLGCFAVRNILNVKAGCLRKANKVDSLNKYFYNKDTITIKLPLRFAAKQQVIINRKGFSQLLTFNGEQVYVRLCADVNNDGYLDIIFSEHDNVQSTEYLYLSTVQTDGTVILKKETEMTYTG